LNQRHIMWRLILFNFLVTSSVQAQQISKKINYVISGLDNICSVESKDSMIFAMTANVLLNGCHEDQWGHGSIFRTDLQGNVLEQKITSNCDSSFFYTFSSSPTCFDVNDERAVAVYGDLKSVDFRVLDWSFKGDTLRIFRYQGIGDRTAQLSLKQLNNETYLLLGILEGSNWRSELWILGENFEIKEKKLLSNQQINRMALSVTRDSTLLIILSKLKSIQDREIILQEYDLDLNLLKAHVYDKDVNNSSLPNAYKTEDGGYICSWAVDYESRTGKPFFSDTFPYPPTIIKFDSTFQFEWEYFFIERNYNTEVLSFKDLGNGRYLGSGRTWEFELFDTLINGLADAPGGYAFLITEDGEVEWRRYITDLRSNRFNGFFWDGCAIPGGYAFGGKIDTLKEVADPFLNDPASWVVTLDSNGCWNGNCNDHIIIINDDSSTTIEMDTMTTAVPQQPIPNRAEIKAYPNPSSGIVNVEFSQAAVRSLHIMSSDGNVLREIQTRGSKAILHIGGYPPGLYLIYVYDQNDKLEGVQKIILI